MRLTDKFYPVVDWCNIQYFGQMVLIGHVRSFIEADLRLNKVIQEYGNIEDYFLCTFKPNGAFIKI